MLRKFSKILLVLHPQLSALTAAPNCRADTKGADVNFGFIPNRLVCVSHKYPKIPMMGKFSTILPKSPPRMRFFYFYLEMSSQQKDEAS